MSETQSIAISRDLPDPAAIEQAAKILRDGGTVAFPTETVYGLGADAMNAAAVQEVFDAKGRPADNPLIVHIASPDGVVRFARDLSPKGIRLARRFWPGPLTLVTSSRAEVPRVVTAGLSTVALRVPDHPVALALLKKFDGGIVGPSANTSGRPSPTSAGHVYDDLKGKIDLILDAGPTMIGIESTVVDVTIDPPAILRKGGLAIEDILQEIGNVQVGGSSDVLRRSPGTSHRHYAPRASVIIVSPGNREGLQLFLVGAKAAGKSAGTITYSEHMNDGGVEHRIVLSPSVELYARDLFRALRELDKKGIDIILVEGVEEKGIGAAVMDRLRKAAEGRE
jgi:L-threonylcarbamoyladenylate synthase